MGRDPDQRPADRKLSLRNDELWLHGIQTLIGFLNGLYWGIHNIREKFDKNYFSENFNAGPDNIDHLEYSRTETGTELLIVEGTMSHYNEMIDYLMSNNLNDPAIYDQVQEWMDIDSFIDHLVMTMYCANTSWGHNREWWRPRTENGKWKWLIVDLDRGFNIFNVFTNLLDLSLIHI